MSALRDAIVADKQFGKFWRAPFGEAAGLPPVTELHGAVFNAETWVEKAAVGGAMLRRVKHDAAFQTSAADLAGTPPLMLLQGLPAEKPLAESFARLMESMVARHEQVSVNKNRQR